jgi:hypothetical protein
MTNDDEKVPVGYEIQGANKRIGYTVHGMMETWKGETFKALDMRMIPF